MKIHDRGDLREQIAFLSYYFHWSYDEILHMSHLDRKAYCEEIMRIHREEQGTSISLKDIH